MVMFEYDDKAGRLLAHHLMNRSATQHVTQIKKPDRVLTTDTKELNEAFTVLVQPAHITVC